MATGLKDPAKLKSYKFSIPFVGEMEWEPDPTQRKAAWELYVELVTRISTQPLDLDQGLVREALNSLYSLFGTTRQILRSAGPEVGAGPETVGGIAITVLNKGLRPVLSKWHPQLQAHEVLRPPSISPKEWERQWKEEAAMRGELEKLRGSLEKYATVLAKMAGVKL
jgi:hypothetical protein